MSPEIMKIFDELPPDFCGHIEVHFQFGRPTLSKVNRVRHFNKNQNQNTATPSGRSQEINHVRYSTYQK